jgi:hypothetical protein
MIRTGTKASDDAMPSLDSGPLPVESVDGGAGGRIAKLERDLAFLLCMQP